MTIQEARERWCPMVRYSAQGESAANRWLYTGKMQENPEQACCIGPDCMLWRWIDSPHTKGYCGLGGKP